MRRQVPSTGRLIGLSCRAGASIKVVPYAPDLSAGISFGGWLNDGGALAQRLREAAITRMALGATDGETYGHHHRYGEMALAYALERLAADDEVVEVVNP